MRKPVIIAVLIAIAIICIVVMAVFGNSYLPEHLIIYIVIAVIGILSVVTAIIEASR